jgi:hypothetical protein
MLKAAAEEYVKSHLVILAWNAFLLFGGLIFLLYFVSVRYLPDLNLKDSAFLLAVAAVTGFFFVGVMSTGLIFPGVIWSSLVESRSFRALWPGDQTKRMRRAALFLGAPLMTLGAVFSLSLHVREKDWYLFTLGSIPAIFLFGLLLAAPLFYVRRRKLIRRAWRLGVAESSRKSLLISLRQSFNYWLLYFLSCLFFFVPFVILYLVARRVAFENLWQRVVMLALLLAFVVLFNVLAAVVPKGRNQIFWRALLGIVALFLLLIVCAAFSSISATVMRLYGLGNIPDVSIIVNKDGCTTFRQIGLTPVCEINDTCRFDGLDIVSRLGNSYYLVGTDPQGHKTWFTVPSTFVISWGIKSVKDAVPPQPPK